MPIASARAPQPNKRKGRTATVQPLQDSSNISKTVDNSTFRQVQFLTVRFGVSAVRASLLATLCWGVQNG